MARTAAKTGGKPKARRLAPVRKPDRPVPNPTSVPRTPTRGRGIARYRALVEATESLLMDHSPDEVGLYQIAECAGVPPASVYHFFPSKEAAFLALAHHYVEQMDLRHSEPIQASALRSWQDLSAIDMRRAMQFHNEHPPLMKINFGGFGSVGSRQIDDLYAQKIAAAQYQRLNSLFHMPPMRDAERIFEMRVAIIDAIWGVSFRRHGEITEWYFQEAYNAVAAFMLQFLPARVEPRDTLVAAAARNEFLRLPFGSTPGVSDAATRRNGRR